MKIVYFLVLHGICLSTAYIRFDFSKNPSIFSAKRSSFPVHFEKGNEKTHEYTDVFP